MVKAEGDTSAAQTGSGGDITAKPDGNGGQGSAKPADSKMLETLRKAVDDNAKLVRTIYVGFLAYCLYCAMLAGSTTDEQLLLNQAPKLPFVQIELPMTGVFFIAPLLLVIFHFDLMLQMNFLSRAVWQFKERLDLENPSPSDRFDHLDALNSSPFVYMLLNEQYGRIMKHLMILMIWLTVLFAPLSVLAAMHAAFLPYHHGVMHYFHIALIVIDALQIAYFWPQYFGMVWPFKPKPGLIFEAARSARLNAIGLSCSATIMLLIVFWCIAGGFRPYGFPGFSIEAAERYDFLRSAFPRRTLMVVDPASTAGSEAGKPLNLSDRDLRDAVIGRSLSNADLTKALLSGADFSKSNMSGAVMVLRGNQQKIKLPPNTYLKVADFEGADLSGSEFIGLSVFSNSDNQFANFRGAILHGVNFSFAELYGASFNDADLKEAVMKAGRFHGAEFVAANLSNVDAQKAVFTGANLDGAKVAHSDFTAAKFHGSRLTGATLDGVVFIRSEFKYANLYEAQILAPRKVQEAAVSKLPQRFNSCSDPIMAEGALFRQSGDKVGEGIDPQCMTVPQASELNYEYWSSYYQNLWRTLEDSNYFCLSSGALRTMDDVMNVSHRMADSKVNIELAYLEHFWSSIIKLIRRSDMISCPGAAAIRNEYPATELEEAEYELERIIALSKRE